MTCDIQIFTQILAEADYILLSSELMFAVGETIQCADINIVDDSTVESDELFFVEISSDDATITFGSTISAVFITDNDGK